MGGPMEAMRGPFISVISWARRHFGHMSARVMQMTVWMDFFLDT